MKVTDNELRELAELRIRQWLNSYLHEESVIRYVRMAAIAAGFKNEYEALSYLQGVLHSKVLSLTDRDNLLAIVEEMSDASNGLRSCDELHAALWAQRIREVLGETAL